MTALTLSQQFDQMDVVERWNRSEEYSFTEIEITCDYCGNKFKTNYKHYGNRNQYCSKSCRDAGFALAAKLTYQKRGYAFRGAGFYILYDATPDDEYGNSGKFPPGAYFSSIDIDKLRRENLIADGTILQKENTGEKWIAVVYKRGNTTLTRLERMR